MVDWEKQTEALRQSITKLDPRYLIKNPVMFVVEIGFLMTLILTLYPPSSRVRRPDSIMA